MNNYGKFLVITAIGLFISVVLYLEGPSDFYLSNGTYSFQEVENRTEIYFLETSTRRNLTIRQACSVESAAFENRNATVTVFMSLGSDQPVSELHEALKKAYKVRFRQLNHEDIFKDTPLEGFNRRNDFLRSPHRISHASDALRAALLWKHGGIYLDLDVLVLRPLDSFKHLVVSERENTYFSNCVLFFERHHDFLLAYMKAINDSYNSGEHSGNGPFLMTNVLKKFCNHSFKNCSVHVMPTHSMLEIPYPQWRWFFYKKTTEEVMQRIVGSYAVHFWNKFSGGRKVIIGSNTAYELLAKKHCPITYHYALQYGFF